MGTVIEVESLRKAYGRTVAVDGVSFEVRRGEVFGMVGPNGAGKTTTIECVEGLRRPDGGYIRVLGLDPQRDRIQLLQRIGVQLQESNLAPRLKVGEAMRLFASFYPRSVDGEILLERLGLAEKRDTYYDKLSGGQKQRLFIALALINDPEIVFLDELTTGLDPHARRDMWDLVREVRDQGKTVFLTTHYMEEAEELCDRVAIIDRGRVIALDTPEALIASLDSESRVAFTYEGPLDVEALRRLPEVSRLEAENGTVTVYGRGESLLPAVVNAVAAGGAVIRTLQNRRASLEDVFLALTGRPVEEAEDA